MKLHDYLESVYVSTNIDVQKNYNVYLQAKVNAIQSLIGLQRSVYKKLAYFSIIYGFIAVRLGWKEPPLSAGQYLRITNKIKDSETDKGKSAE